MTSMDRDEYLLILKIYTLVVVLNRRRLFLNGYTIVDFTVINYTIDEFIFRVNF